MASVSTLALLAGFALPRKWVQKTEARVFLYASSVAWVCFIACMVASTIFNSFSSRELSMASIRFLHSVPFILGWIKIFIYSYIKRCHYLIKGVEARLLAIILVTHDGTWSPVNNISQLLLRHPDSLPRPLDGEPYIVKIKPSFISLNLQISPNVILHFRYYFLNDFQFHYID